MNCDIVIRAEGLGKSYTIGHNVQRERYAALRDVITDTAKNLLHSSAEILRGRAVVAGDALEEFWALRDLNFEVKRGEVLGIIGRNGAGKSTLLKILSRITEPTEGRVTIKGRVASLLEVGTGFHPEMTGRENIFLNGAILGMTRAEIRRKFDEIVDFAEVEKFLDTPVKRYSSGMYVRLAFAVAAHLEPEILVVDEVLAVGDHEFQRKCLGKIQHVSGAFGRTVLFVSHDLAAVESLTKRVLFIKDGGIAFDGDTDLAIKKYVASGMTSGFASKVEGRGEHTRIMSAQFVDNDGRVIQEYEPSSPLRLSLEIETDGTRGLSFDVYISTSKGQKIYFYSSALFDNIDLPRQPGIHKLHAEFQPLKLAVDEYIVDVATAFANISYDHYASKIAVFNVGRSNPSKRGYNFLAQAGVGVVYMETIAPVVITESDIPSEAIA